MHKKPRERIKEIHDASLRRYSEFDIDTQKIATLLNVVDKIGEILDELEEKITKK